MLLLLAAAGLAGCGGDDEGDDTANDTGRDGSASGSAPAAGVTCDYPRRPGPAAKEVDAAAERRRPSRARSTVTIETTLGDLEATLDADEAPCTVNSFVSLAEQGYFDDTPCHRLTTEGHLRAPVRRPDRHRHAAARATPSTTS